MEVKKGWEKREKKHYLFNKAKAQSNTKMKKKDVKICFMVCLLSLLPSVSKLHFSASAEAISKYCDIIETTKNPLLILFDSARNIGEKFRDICDLLFSS